MGSRSRLVVWPLGAALAVLGCAEPDPDFGTAGTRIVFRDEEGTTPAGDGGAKGTGLFPSAYDPANPAPPAKPGNDLHKEKAGFALSPTTECMGCHAQDKQGATTKWAFAGYASGKDGKPLANGEVIVVNGADVLANVKTASDGYFWAPAASGAVGAQAKTAARDATGTVSSMKSSLGGIGNCSSTSCHGGGAGPIDFKP